MNLRHKSITLMTALFLVVAVTQVYIGFALAAPAGTGAAALDPQLSISGILRTSDNRQITVNGAGSTTGATILTGAMIETPDNVSATIDLGAAGVVEMPPGSKIQLDFDANGNVRVKQIQGCVVVRRKANVLPDSTSEIYTDHASEKTNQTRKRLGFCVQPDGSLVPQAGGGGLSGRAIAAIVIGGAGGAIGIGVGLRGSNPSPSTP